MGMLYTGAMEKGQMHGKGSLVYANNEKYEGDFEYGKRHGYGVYSYADGGRFEGEWIDDKVHGRGVSIYASGNRYEGEWVDGKINGQGTLWYADGDRYQGEWRDGKMHGRGTYTYADGDRYEGDWKDDRRHGKGTVTYAAPEGGVAEKYEGDWLDGKMHGFAAPHFSPAPLMASRPTVTVFSSSGSSTSSTPLPGVFLAPVRPDVVHQVTVGLAKNKRQPYCVNKYAGKSVAASSWGTGRAVSRIPRVQGGGTHRSGQGAYGNMCRGGRMFAPTKTWRKWHAKINVTQRRYAACSAIAASGVTPLVMARGHRVDETPECPLVVDSSVQALTKTAAAVALLKKLGAYVDVEKVIASRSMRAGKGKMRNRRFVQRRGPLVIYDKDDGITRAFRNIPGVELACVDSLNVLQLAPGGHLGRFCVWTEAAFAKLDALYGTSTSPSTEKTRHKTPYRMPQLQMANADLSRLINSDEVQSVINAPKEGQKKAVLKRNPLKSKSAMDILNPAAASFKKAATEARAIKKAKAKRDSSMKSTFYQMMKAD